MAQKILQFNRNEILIFILCPLVGFYENLIFENWHFHHPLELLFSNYLVHSTHIFLFKGGDGSNQTSSKWKSLISSLFLSLWQLTHPAAPMLNQSLKLSTSLALPKSRHFGGNGSTQYFDPSTMSIPKFEFSK